MMGWETTSLNLVNNGLFEIVAPGTLHVPIHRFAIRRDDMLRLVLETEGPGNATSTAIDYRAGTLRISSETVELVSVSGVKAVLSGVEPCHYSLTQSSHKNAFRELVRVHELTVTPGERGKAAYTIEWLENLSGEDFSWPDLIRTTIGTHTNHRLGLADDGITISESDSIQWRNWSAARLTILGYTLVVCRLHPKELNAGINPGCIVYVGTPNDLVREKIRTALALALGSCLIELGHTLYDEEWNIVHVALRSAYNPYGRALQVPAPLAPVSDGRTRNIIDRAVLSRMTHAFVDSYDRLDLANLSWSYWHACAATPHIAPVQFGAAIEALLRAYAQCHPGSVRTEILDRMHWKQLRKLIAYEIENLDVPDGDKRALCGKLNEVNRMPQRTVLKAVAQATGIELGSAENAAWKRRNHAAHGTPIAEGDELAAIRDVKLLRVLFHRLLLASTKASDSYIDYASLDHPYRRLPEPTPEAFS